MKTKKIVCLLFCSLCPLLSLNEAFAQRPDRPNREQRTQSTAKQDDQQSEKPAATEKETEKPKAIDKKLTAVVGGEIHTATGEVIRRGTVLIEDGKIKAVGRNIEVPDGAEIIDATGKVVSPGFVAINMSGLAVRGNVTGNNKLADAFDPFDRNLKYALGVGITSGCIELARGGGGGGRRGRSEEMPQFPDQMILELAIAENRVNDSDGYSEGAVFDGARTSSESVGDNSNDDNSVANNPREVTLQELLGYNLREGEPEHRFLGIDPEIGEYVTESQLDYGMENTELCPCCNLPIMPTEPIEAAPPSREQPRRHAAIKLSYGNLEDMLVKEDVFYSPSPGALSGALNRHNWRRAIKSAREELKKTENPDVNANRGNQSQAQNQSRARSGGGQGESPDANQARQAAAATASRARPSSNPLFPLLKKEVALRVTANTASEVRDMVALAEELDYDLVVEGGVEAWLAVSELSRSGAQVVYTPRRRRNPQVGQENESGSSIESTQMFESQGVPFAITPLSNSISMGGLAGRDLTSLPLEAAFAVRGGASDLAALQSITLVPARMMGLDDRIGSIEVGKDADLLIMNGEPLDYRSYVETAIVSGKICYQRDIDRVFPVYQRE